MYSEKDKIAQYCVISSVLFAIQRINRGLGSSLLQVESVISNVACKPGDGRTSEAIQD